MLHRAQRKSIRRRIYIDPELAFIAGEAPASPDTPGGKAGPVAAGECITAALVGAAEFPTETANDDAALATEGGLTADAKPNGVEVMANTEKEPLELAETAAAEAASSDVKSPAWNVIPASDCAPWVPAFSACSRASCKIINPSSPQLTSNGHNAKDARTGLILLFQFNKIPSTLQELSILIPL